MTLVAANTSSLYVLVFPSKRLLKIGKANNVHIRCEKLRQTWGAADYAQSFELVAPQSTVFKLEKSLHFMLSAHSANESNGDGYTEMFSLDAMDIAMMHIELFVASSSIPMILKKGIDAPCVPQKARNKADVGMDLSRLGVGAIGQIGVMAWAIYCVIRSEAGPESRHASLTIPAIGEIVGTSNDTIRLALNKLESAGMLTIKKKGRINFYSWL